MTKSIFLRVKTLMFSKYLPDFILMGPGGYGSSAFIVALYSWKLADSVDIWGKYLSIGAFLNAPNRWRLSSL
jgi:hypothetical protein